MIILKVVILEARKILKGVSKHQHKNTCNNENSKNYNLNIYKFIREKGGWTNFEMKPIEEFICDTKLQATIREQYWINFYKADLNSKNAHSSDEEKKEHRKVYDEIYTENNKVKIKERKKEYYEKNKNEIQEKKSKLHICECGSKLRIDGNNRTFKISKTSKIY